MNDNHIIITVCDRRVEAKIVQNFQEISSGSEPNPAGTVAGAREAIERLMVVAKMIFGKELYTVETLFA